MTLFTRSFLREPKKLPTSMASDDMDFARVQVFDRWVIVEQGEITVREHQVEQTANEDPRLRIRSLTILSIRTFGASIASPAASKQFC